MPKRAKCGTKSEPKCLKTLTLASQIFIFGALGAESGPIGDQHGQVGGRNGLLLAMVVQMVGKLGLQHAANRRAALERGANNLADLERRRILQDPSAECASNAVPLLDLEV